MDLKESIFIHKNKYVSTVAHKSDSIQDTEYIANPFFLILRVSMEKLKINNDKLIIIQTSCNIIVQKLKILGTVTDLWSVP